MKKYKLKSKLSKKKLKKIFEKNNLFINTKNYFNNFLKGKIKNEILENIFLNYYGEEKIEKINLIFENYSIIFNFENEKYILKIRNSIINENGNFIGDFFSNLEEKNFYISKN